MQNVTILISIVLEKRKFYYNIFIFTTFVFTLDRFCLHIVSVLSSHCFCFVFTLFLFLFPFLFICIQILTGVNSAIFNIYIDIYIELIRRPLGPPGCGTTLLESIKNQLTSIQHLRSFKKLISIRTSEVSISCFIVSIFELSDILF